MSYQFYLLAVCGHRIICAALFSFFLAEMFAIVAFPEEENSLAVVHKTWLNEKEDNTFWPSTRNPVKRRRMTMEGAAPSADWTQARCLVMCWAGKLHFVFLVFPF